MTEEPCPNHHKQQPSFDIPSSYSSTSLSSYLPSDSESGPEPETDRHAEELRDMVLTGPLPTLFNRRKRLTKQLSLCETPRDRAWEKRRRQFQLNQERRKIGLEIETDATTGSLTELNITDEDLHELKGCIDLGFGFNEEDGQGLTNTLPALDLYFAVNRQFSPSPVSTPTGSSSSRRSSSFASPKSESDSWKICNPGDAPEQVKTKLRHWAQAVACSVKQSY